MSERYKLSGTAYCKLKATRNGENRKFAASLLIFPQNKYVTKVKCKDGDVECTSELGGEEHRENANIVETNKEIKAKEESPAGINVDKELEGNCNDVLKDESSSAFGKDRYEYEEGTDEVTGNKEIEQRLLCTKTLDFGHELVQGNCLLIL